MERISLCEVGPRDGLQNDPVTLAPAVRAELCTRLAVTGLARVEAVSFVHPARVPQMAGAEQVVAALEHDGAACFSGLVLNRRGLDRALAAGLREVHVSYALTDAFSRRNQGMSLDEAALTAERMLTDAVAAGVRATATLGTAFGCPFEGLVPEARVLAHAERAVAAGAAEVLLADTIGVGVPSQVRRLVARALEGSGTVPIGLHLHNTRNTGYVNALAGIEAGATVLDASIGGLGGCPFAPRATGNIATEDLVYLLDGMGIETGVRLDALLEVNAWLGDLLGRELPGLVARAGPFPPAA